MRIHQAKVYPHKSRIRIKTNLETEIITNFQPIKQNQEKCNINKTLNKLLTNLV